MFSKYFCALFTSDYTQNRKTHKSKPVPIQKELKNEKDFVQHLHASATVMPATEYICIL